jgi:hypothetical protein
MVCICIQGRDVGLACTVGMKNQAGLWHLDGLQGSICFLGLSLPHSHSLQTLASSDPVIDQESYLVLRFDCNVLSNCSKPHSSVSSGWSCLNLLAPF